MKIHTLDDFGYIKNIPVLRKYTLKYFGIKVLGRWNLLPNGSEN